MFQPNMNTLERKMRAAVGPNSERHTARPGMLLRLLACGLALAAALMVSVPSSSASSVSNTLGAAYGAADYYVLVHDCAGQSCLRAADWAPYEQRVQQWFHDGDWGRDPSVASHSDPHAITWAQWAAAHMFYVDEQTARARRNAIQQLRRDLGSGVAIHTFSVPSKR